VLLTEKLLHSRYTIDLVEYLRGVYPESEYDMTLIIGSDNLAVMHDWHRWQDLENLVDFFILPRAGTTDLLFSMPDVSSTQVRETLAVGNPVDDLVPPAVLDYILAHRLYAEKTPQ
jgi:nicotinate-nucleotide adenylyltransferase